VDVGLKLLDSIAPLRRAALAKATSFFAQLASCCVEMFTFSTQEIGAASIVLACDLIGDTPTADAVLAAVPGPRTRECAAQLHATCAIRGLTPAASQARVSAPDGPPATTPAAPTGALGPGGPEADGVRSAEITPRVRR
jgi:hypothetical protein